MNLQKTSGTAVDKAPLQNAPPAQNLPALAKTPAPLPLAEPRSVSSMIAAAGLPADKLSSSIISFARFFSLPIKPELMTEIRRQAFTQTAMPQTASEAFSLAAAAAESKGVTLLPNALAAFADAIHPEAHEPQEAEQKPSGDGQQQKQQNKNRNEQNESASQKTNPMTAAGAKALALESAENNPLFAILNRLPGKNGQRWIVLPFEVCENERQFRVSMRIFLETESLTNKLRHKLVLDIIEGAVEPAETGETGQRWLFVLNAANRLSVFLEPDRVSKLTPKAKVLFINELSLLLEIPAEHISVKTLTEPFPFEAGSSEKLLRAIDEAV